MTTTGIRARAAARARLTVQALAALVAASACHAADPAQTADTTKGSVSNAQGTREYTLHVPPKLGKEPRPLLVALHGCLQAPEQLAGAARLDALAARERLLVLYPQQSAMANPARCWNWFDPEHQKRGAGEPGLIAAMIQEVRDKHPVDPARIYVFGLSAGAMMTGTLLACYPDVFAAGAIVAGGMYGGASSLAEGMQLMRAGSERDPAASAKDAWQCGGQRRGQAVPVLVMHGDADKVVALVNAEQAVAQFAALNDLADDGEANGSVRRELVASESPKGSAQLGHACRQSEGSPPLLQHCVVSGLGHAWSGGDGSFPYAEPKGPDATAMVWSFLKQHARRPAR